jgi:hypothetical protein
MSSATSILKLQSVGFTHDQVEALAALVDDRAATKDDIRDEIGKLRTEMIIMKVDMIKWAIGLALAQTGVILAFLKFTTH